MAEFSGPGVNAFPFGNHRTNTGSENRTSKSALASRVSDVFSKPGLFVTRPSAISIESCVSPHIPHHSLFHYNPSTNLCLRKRNHADEANDSEDSPVPSKKPASEEAISKQFSSLNISTPSSNSFCDEVEMLPLDKISDEVDSDESDVEESLRLPEELCKAYNLLKTTGSLPDPHLQKIFASKPCLAVVPYVPRPTLPLLPASDAPARDNPMPDPDTADDSDSAEPMESQSISSALYMPNLPVDWVRPIL
uniref:Uncharacterized protein n=1 Tax=Mesocestoides corti TaxID=53468 RepID=A0A5K3ETP1_MESCO